MYTLKKSGALYQVVSPSGLVQFSSLKKVNCAQWIKETTESQEEKENKFCEDMETA